MFDAADLGAGAEHLALTIGQVRWCARRVVDAGAEPVDVSVVVGDIARGDLVVTSDRNDIKRLAGALGASLEIVRV